MAQEKAQAWGALALRFGVQRKSTRLELGHLGGRRAGMNHRDRALHLLLGRYPHDEAMRLYGEYVVLVEEPNPELALAKPAAKLRVLYRKLSAVGLWPEHLTIPPETGLLARASKAITGLLGKPEALPPEDATPPQTAQGGQMEGARSPHLAYEAIARYPLAVELAPELLSHPAVGGLDAPLHELVPQARLRVAEALGVVFPLVEMAEWPMNEAPQTEGVGPRPYRIRVLGEVVAEGSVEPDAWAIVAPAEAAQGAGWRPHPARPGRVLRWASEAEAKAQTHEVQAPAALLAEHLEAEVQRNASRLLTDPALELLLEAHSLTVGRQLIDELLNRFLSLTELRLVLQALLDRGHSLRALPRILDLLLVHCIRHLSGRQLSMDETWKVSSHLPYFPTEALVQVVCEGLGWPTGDAALALQAQALERSLRLGGPTPRPPGLATAPLDPAELSDHPELKPERRDLDRN